MPHDLPLAALQRDMAEALAEGAPSPELLACILGPGAADRLARYGTSRLAALAGALRLTFPAVLRLVGDVFFDATAVAFVRRAPPRQADLSRYGEAFPDFLADFAPAAGLPWLADVARIEAAVEAAALLSRPDGVTARLPGLRLTVTPTLQVLALHHPAVPLWRAVLDRDDDRLAALDLRPAPLGAAVWRDEDGVRVAALSETSRVFLAVLMAGRSAADALAAAAAQDPDAVAVLTREVLAAPFADLRPDSPSRSDIP